MHAPERRYQLRKGGVRAAPRLARSRHAIARAAPAPQRSPVCDGAAVSHDASSATHSGLAVSRRGLLSAAALLLLPAPKPAAAAPAVLRSLHWAVPAEMVILNQMEGMVKVYWINYDGDSEFFGTLQPGSIFTVRTYESHAWRFVDAASGAVLGEHVAAGGPAVVRVASSAIVVGPTAAAVGANGPGPTASYTSSSSPPSSASASAAPLEGQGLAAPSAAADAPPPRVMSATPASQVAAAEGFDGLGGREEQYSLAQLREVSIYPGGGVVLLSLPGQAAPLEVGLAGPEALSLVAATGSAEGRRPSTLGTWGRSLVASGVTLQRVCITRVVDGVLYCRLLLERPAPLGAGVVATGADDGAAGREGGVSVTSLDATPGDSLALALALRRPIYVANEVARVHASMAAVFARRRAAAEAAAASGLLDEAAEAEADREAQDVLDAIAASIPSAPRPVHVPAMDRGLEA